MGNCIGLQPAKTWMDDEDSESPEFICSGGCKTTPNSQEIIKIRISKKQFEEILNKHQQVRGYRNKEILTDVLNKGVVVISDCRRQWRPALTSIAEIPE